MQLLTFEEMLIELESNYLEVVLIPAIEIKHSGHCIRAVSYQNAFWYQRFCRQYSSGRKNQNKKGRTRIKRRETIFFLKQLANAEKNQKQLGTLPIFPKWKSQYCQRLLEFKECENKKRIQQMQMSKSPIPEPDGIMRF